MSAGQTTRAPQQCRSCCHGLESAANLVAVVAPGCGRSARCAAEAARGRGRGRVGEVREKRVLSTNALAQRAGNHQRAGCPRGAAQLGPRAHTAHRAPTGPCCGPGRLRTAQAAAKIPHRVLLGVSAKTPPPAPTGLTVAASNNHRPVLALGVGRRGHKVHRQRGGGSHRSERRQNHNQLHVQPVRAMRCVVCSWCGANRAMRWPPGGRRRAGGGREHHPRRCSSHSPHPCPSRHPHPDSPHSSPPPCLVQNVNCSNPSHSLERCRRPLRLRTRRRHSGRRRRWTRRPTCSCRGAGSSAAPMPRNGAPRWVRSTSPSLSVVITFFCSAGAAGVAGTNRGGRWGSVGAQPVLGGLRRVRGPQMPLVVCWPAGTGRDQGCMLLCALAACSRGSGGGGSLLPGHPDTAT